MVKSYEEGLGTIKKAYEFITDDLKEDEKLDLTISTEEWDDLDMIEFVMEIEEEMDTDIDDETHEGWKTLQCVVDLLISRECMSAKLES